MRRKTIYLRTVISCCLLGLMTTWAQADVVIKVRALNPLEVEEMASIRYPLPKEIQPEDIIAKDIKYSKPEESEEEPRTTTFKVEYVEDEGAYYIIDEIPLKPREVVTLEARMRDIWMIPQEKINGIKQEVEGLIAQVVQEIQTGGEVWEEGGEEAEIDETVMALKREILKELDELVSRQAGSTVLKVGVQAHMEVYYENKEALEQVESDVLMMRYLLEPEPEEGEIEGEEK